MKTLFSSIVCASMLLVAPAASAAEKLTLVVMDPLSKELACDCVKGYAQRNYHALAAHLQKKLGMEVMVVHAEHLETVLKENKQAPGIIIGKQSVVLNESRKHKLEVTPVARLTGKDGSPDQRGLIVVRKDSPARAMADLNGYRILFGPEDCDEKCAAAVALLKVSGIDIPEKREVSASCSTAAAALMEMKADVRAAAVISSYAEPLLAGCDTIKPGDLRVIGKTEPVPFITAFAVSSLPSKTVAAITEALLDMVEDPALLTIMESLGFIEMTARPEVKPAAWNQFRGPNRDGTASWLPEKLPARAEFTWRKELPADGVGGIAATSEAVIVGTRDALDGNDVFFVWKPAQAPSAGGSNIRRLLVNRSTMGIPPVPHL
jgi:ABC-type phosphate/phosphonate transport system substrate-binding protein